MKKTLILLTLFYSFVFAFSSDTKGIYAIGIFDAAGNGENVQHVRKTKANYNGTCYTKIFYYGTRFKVKPQVTIGSSIGHFVNTRPIYDKSNIKIGEEMLYRHFNVTSGLIRVTLRNRVYDSKVFVK